MEDTAVGHKQPGPHKGLGHKNTLEDSMGGGRAPRVHRTRCWMKCTANGPPSEALKVVSL